MGHDSDVSSFLEGVFASHDSLLHTFRKSKPP
jgi:hypothetical protein